ncbi:unnamed protein product, partial [Musa acuminata subsp. burmannicoides]
SALTYSCCSVHLITPDTADSFPEEERRLLTPTREKSSRICYSVTPKLKGREPSLSNGYFSSSALPLGSKKESFE